MSHSSAKAWKTEATADVSASERPPYLAQLFNRRVLVQQSEYEQQHGEFELGGEGRAGSPHPTGHGSQVNEWPPHDEPQDVPGSDGGLGWPDERKAKLLFDPMASSTCANLDCVDKYRSYEERGDRKARHGPHKNTRHRENRDDSPNNGWQPPLPPPSDTIRLY